MRHIGIVIGCLGLALAGCKGEEKKATGGVASGEVLPGAASDAMLPLDTVKSQAPLAPKAVSDGKPADKADKAASRTASDSAQKPSSVHEPAAAAEPAAAEDGE